MYFPINICWRLSGFCVLWRWCWASTSINTLLVATANFLRFLLLFVLCFWWFCYFLIIAVGYFFENFCFVTVILALLLLLLCFRHCFRCRKNLFQNFKLSFWFFLVFFVVPGTLDFQCLVLWLFSFLGFSVYQYIYIYIYIEREREREIER